jgi:methylthioribose-1-phosphate isomerase
MKSPVFHQPGSLVYLAYTYWAYTSDDINSINTIVIKAKTIVLVLASGRWSNKLKCYPLTVLCCKENAPFIVEIPESYFGTTLCLM